MKIQASQRPRLSHMRRRRLHLSLRRRRMKLLARAKPARQPTRPMRRKRVMPRAPRIFRVTSSNVVVVGVAAAVRGRSRKAPHPKQ
jgi:hypothetical protein